MRITINHAREVKQSAPDTWALLDELECQLIITIPDLTEAHMTPDNVFAEYVRALPVGNAAFDSYLTKKSITRLLIEGKCVISRDLKVIHTEFFRQIYNKENSGLEPVNKITEIKVSCYANSDEQINKITKVIEDFCQNSNEIKIILCNLPEKLMDDANTFEEFANRIKDDCKINDALRKKSIKQLLLDSSSTRKIGGVAYFKKGYSTTYNVEKRSLEQTSPPISIPCPPELCPPRKRPRQY